MPMLALGTYGLTLADPSEGDVIVEEVTADRGPVATMRLKCPWQNRYALWAYMGGTATGGPGAIVRNEPVQYPGDPHLYCLGIGNARPVGTYLGGFLWNWCEFTATFGVPQFSFPSMPEGVTDPSAKEYTTTRIRVSADVQQVPFGTFKWTSGANNGQPVPDSQLGIMVPHYEIDIVRHMMPFVPVSEIGALAGTINSGAVRIGNHDFPAGRLLFVGGGGEINADTAANRTFQVAYSLMGVYGHTWNQLLDSGLVWVTVNTAGDGSGTPPFASSDFWNLLP